MQFCSIFLLSSVFIIFFFFNDTATTEIYTLSLHDALPIATHGLVSWAPNLSACSCARLARSEEHTSELQSRPHLVCRLLLEKKKNNHQRTTERQKTNKPRKHTRNTTSH